jgi:hypothetical protein
MLFDRRSIWFPCIPSPVARAAILNRYSIVWTNACNAVMRSGNQWSLPYQALGSSVGV